MRTPFDKIKKADRALRAYSIFCLFLGLLIIGDTLYLYLDHDFSGLWDKTLPEKVYKPIIKGSLVAVCVVLPAIGFGFILVAYGIWNYRRKRGDVQDHDKTDA
jgi:hypothetical protein